MLTKIETAPAIPATRILVLSKLSLTCLKSSLISINCLSASRVWFLVTASSTASFLSILCSRFSVVTRLPFSKSRCKSYFLKSLAGKLIMSNTLSSHFQGVNLASTFSAPIKVKIELTISNMSLKFIFLLLIYLQVYQKYPSYL